MENRIYRESNMAEEVTIGELARLIERNHLETRDDIAAVNTRLDREFQGMNGRMDRTVMVDVYASDRRGDEERFKRIETDVAAFRATARWAIGLAATVAIGMIGVLVPVLLG